MYMIANLPAGGATAVVLGTGRVVGATIICDGLFTGGFQTTNKM